MAHTADCSFAVFQAMVSSNIGNQLNEFGIGAFRHHFDNYDFPIIGFCLC